MTDPHAMSRGRRGDRGRRAHGNDNPMSIPWCVAKGKGEERERGRGAPALSTVTMRRTAIFSLVAAAHAWTPAMHVRSSQRTPSHTAQPVHEPRVMTGVGAFRASPPCSSLL